MSAEPEILQDDPGFVVVNKPSGMLCEGGGERELDLEQAVSKLLGRTVVCCHRLDRMTSGVVVLRKGKRYTKELALQFEGSKIRKEYWLLVDGIWKRSIQKVETRIGPISKGVWANVAEGGKVAISTFRILGESKERNVTLLAGLLKTGRTHQMRLHALAAGCPVLGDPLYGDREAGGLFGLHARSLKMRHPRTGDPLEFYAPPPGAWTEWLAVFDV